MKKFKISIEGMHCASCANNVERAVKKIKDINSVNVSVMTNKAIIEAADSVNPKDIEKAVSSTGFKVVKIE